MPGLEKFYFYIQHCLPRYTDIALIILTSFNILFYYYKCSLHVCNIRLDPALIRPGRVDIKEYIGHCSAHQIEQMFFRFYRIDDTNLAHKLSTAILALGKPVSAAQIQGFFMLHKHSTPDAILKNVSRLWEYS